MKNRNVLLSYEADETLQLDDSLEEKCELDAETKLLESRLRVKVRKLTQRLDHMVPD